MSATERRKRLMIRSAAILGVVAVAGCMRPTIVRDPDFHAQYDPDELASVGQPLPPGVQGLPPGAPLPPLPPPEVLQADLKSKAGTDTVQFPRSGFELEPAAREVLARQALWLLANPRVRISIEGHADVRDSRDHALALGERRASTVRNFLLTQGVPLGQMDIVSWGKERPAVTGAHDATWLQNSRVVLVVKR